MKLKISQKAIRVLIYLAVAAILALAFFVKFSVRSIVKNQSPVQLCAVCTDINET